MSFKSCIPPILSLHLPRREHFTCNACGTEFSIKRKQNSYASRYSISQGEDVLVCPHCKRKDYKKTFFDAIRDAVFR